MNTIIILLLLLRIDHSNILKDHYDMVEVNHHYNESGSERWTQLILWDWYPRKGKFHVQHWVMMKDAYTKSESHKEKYEKARAKIADQIKDHTERQLFYQNSRYIGEFTGGKYYPYKNFKTRKWVIICHDNNGRLRKITADMFRETYTREDPEVLDRKEFHSDLRRGWSSK